MGAQKRIENHGEDIICRSRDSSQTSFSLLDCINGFRWVDDAFDIQRETSTGDLASAFASHNSWVLHAVPPPQIWQACAWDGDFEGNLGDMMLAAGFSSHGELNQCSVG